jgi:hypothetical protein
MVNFAFCILNCELEDMRDDTPARIEDLRIRLSSVRSYL